MTTDSYGTLARQAINDAKRLLDADFADYLGEYRLEIDERLPEAKRRIVMCLFRGRNLFCEVTEDSCPKLPMAMWRLVAELWLKDDTADKGPRHKLGTNQRNPWTRSYRWFPTTLSDKEMDIRQRLAFGWKA